MPEWDKISSELTQEMTELIAPVRAGHPLDPEAVRRMSEFLKQLKRRLQGEEFIRRDVAFLLADLSVNLRGSGPEPPSLSALEEASSELHLEATAVLDPYSD